MVLRRADVVAAALDLLDEEGLDGLTMRRLGASLNVQGGALYRHFPSKEALLDAMAEQLMSGVSGPLPAHLPWIEQLAALAGRVHEALLSRRDGARVVAGTYVAAPNTMGAGARAIEVLCDVGFPPDEAGWITFACFYYVLGHTIEEQALAQVGPAVDWEARIAAAGPAEPVASAMRAVTLGDPAERFAYGVRIFIAGAVAQLEGEKA
jgi:TetR/AcrR family tetracycline transcriptional repressor